MNSSIAIYSWSVLSSCILKSSFSSKTLFWKALSPVFDQVIWKILAKELNLQEQKHGSESPNLKSIFQWYFAVLHLLRFFLLKPVQEKLNPFAISFQNHIESTQLIDIADQWVRFYLTETLSQAVLNVDVFFQQHSSLLQVCNEYRFLIINSNFNLSFGLLRFN